MLSFHFESSSWEQRLQQCKDHRGMGLGTAVDEKETVEDSPVWKQNETNSKIVYIASQIVKQYQVYQMLCIYDYICIPVGIYRVGLGTPFRRGT